MGYRDRDRRDYDDSPKRRYKPIPPGMSFSKFQHICGYHTIVQGKEGHRCICLESERGTCNTYNCPRWRHHVWSSRKP